MFVQLLTGFAIFTNQQGLSVSIHQQNNNPIPSPLPGGADNNANNDNIEVLINEKFEDQTSSTSSTPAPTPSSAQDSKEPNHLGIAATLASVTMVSAFIVCGMVIYKEVTGRGDLPTAIATAVTATGLELQQGGNNQL